MCRLRTIWTCSAGGLRHDDAASKSTRRRAFPAPLTEPMSGPQLQQRRLTYPHYFLLLPSTSLDVSTPCHVAKGPPTKSRSLSCARCLRLGGKRLIVALSSKITEDFSSTVLPSEVRMRLVANGTGNQTKCLSQVICSVCVVGGRRSLWILASQRRNFSCSVRLVLLNYFL